MRPTLLTLALCATTVAACGSQSLDGNHTGTGGVPGFGGSSTGGSNTGGSNTGGSNTGGSIGSTCDSLAQQYQSAVGAAQFCDVGAPGACSQTAISSLGLCGGCPVFVSDTSALYAIRTAYDQAGCGQIAPPNTCGQIDCPMAINSACVSIDGGSKGYCSYAPGTGGSVGAGGSPGTGGNVGAGGSPGAGGNVGAGGSPLDGGVSNCGSLASEYSALLTAEQVCDPSLSDQCGQPVAQSLSPCFTSCVTYVNDATGLNAISARWKQEGCANVAVLCPAIACSRPVGGSCGPSDAGPGTCRNVYGGLPTP